MREYGHPTKCGCIFFLQEEDLSVKIGQYWTALVVEISEEHHHKEIIDNEIYELMNVDMEGRFVRGYGSPVRKTSDN